MDNRRHKINILPQDVVDKIAAGEVIERPASIIKELVENSIDAEAIRIDIYLEESGKKLIRVVDNGVGISLEDIEIAVLNHSTSKIQKAEDISSIMTLGFRGEALPSIGAVSKLKIISRTKDSLVGAEIEVEGGKVSKCREKGSPLGTQVEVHDIFFNTPVRRKFLKTDPTEMAYISEVITRISLVNYKIHFNLVHNGRTVFNLPEASDIKERIVTFFGDEIGNNLIAFKSQWPDLAVMGYMLPPSQDCGNTKMQYIYVNGRYIRDRSILHAISEAYRGMLMPKRNPIVFLFLQIKPSEFDVNVHPTKIEVRFKDTRQIYNQIFSCIKNNLMKSGLAQIPKFVAKLDETTRDKEDRRGKREGLIKSLIDNFNDQTNNNIKSDKGLNMIQDQGLFVSRNKPSGKPLIERVDKTYIQINASYIIEEKPNGINIIDQHALHEIILYEEIKHNIKTSRLVTQQLLIPEVVGLSPANFFTILNLKERLERFGVIIEEFGGNTIIVRSFPQILRDIDCREFIKDLLDEVNESICKEDVDESIDKLIKFMACKAAIKMRQRLTVGEIQELLEKRDNALFTGNCPHGRPTTIFLSFEELDRQFKRR